MPDSGPSSWDEVDDDLKGYLSDTPPTGPFEAPEYQPDYAHCIVVDNLPKVICVCVHLWSGIVWRGGACRARG
jgi:hypothetical protein